MSEPSPYAVIAKVFAQALEMDAPLAVRLRLLADAVRINSPVFNEAVEKLIARLESVGVGQNAPRIGEVMPPFMLPDENGRLVRLADMLGSGPVVISFHRGHWCPYCRLTASALAKMQDRIGSGQMVAITPETRSFNAQLIARTGIGYRVLTDPDSGYALSINLAFWLDDGFATLMRSVGKIFLFSKPEAPGFCLFQPHSSSTTKVSSSPGMLTRITAAGLRWSIWSRHSNRRVKRPHPPTLRHGSG